MTTADGRDGAPGRGHGPAAAGPKDRDHRGHPADAGGDRAGPGRLGAGARLHVRRSRSSSGRWRRVIRPRARRRRWLEPLGSGRWCSPTSARGTAGGSCATKRGRCSRTRVLPRDFDTLVVPYPEKGERLDRTGIMALRRQRRPRARASLHRAHVAQGIEHWPPEPGVAGSNPAVGTTRLRRPAADVRRPSTVLRLDRWRAALVGARVKPNTAAEGRHVDRLIAVHGNWPCAELHACLSGGCPDLRTRSPGRTELRSTSTLSEVP